MSHHTSVRAFATVSLFVCAASLAACSSGGEPSDPHEQLAAVKSALSSPSGKVDATTMKSVSKLYTSMASSKDVFESIGIINDADAKACLSGSSSEGSYDLACATSGKTTGKLSFTLEGSASPGNAQATYIVKLENACSGGACVTGSLIAEAKVAQGTVDTTMAFSADVTKNGQKTHLYVGEQANVRSGSVTAKVVVFDENGDSYVVETSVSDGSATFSVVGDNGSYQCSIGDGTGQCSGSVSFSY